MPSSDELFVEKWANHLAGKFARFAFCDTSGPGLDNRVRQMVAEIERSVRQMQSELTVQKPPLNNAPQPK